MKTFLLSALIILFSFNDKNISRNGKVADDNKKDSTVPEKPATVINHIYITFDDGPLDGSEEIDDAILHEKINVNVFVVGQHAAGNRMKNFYALYKSNPYVEIGNHSYSHAYNHYTRFYSNPLLDVADFLKCQTALQIQNKLARLPGRNQWRLKNLRINDVPTGSACADLLYQHGYKVFGWDVEWRHNSKTGTPLQSVDQMVSIIEEKLKDHKTVKANNLVLLAHDEMFRNGWEESELKQLIDKLKAKRNYSFEHLSNYPDTP